MSTTALYRKYRPQKFKDVLGQDHIVKVLSGAIELDRVAHAYLFSGSRGTGKTSVARIFAREIGCTEKDLYELDGASNNGVDNIRELCDGARTMPFDSPKKVYIIDEVHMLSKGAFNALLKTLEEPPAHVVFILATTELYKVPDTIISRCQPLSFKKPNEETLVKMISVVSKKENIEVEKDATNLIALLGDGSFRDTQVILQQVFSYSKDKKVTLKEVEEVTGAPSSTMSHELILSMLDSNIKKSFSISNKLSISNLDIKIFLKMVIKDLRKVLIIKFAPDMKKELLLEMSKEESQFLDTIQNHQNFKILSAILRELLGVYNEMIRNGFSTLPLELAIIKILRQNDRL